ncbi:DUF4129 domain-containing protein [Microbacterium wangruii]|uniref:DUF4129 domain-containing protein n=1 Tax=Microbacterium wangruii TaxID=3049073 RepID=UPI00256EA5CC|nr:DUF4129 domain-containing protein [Microbacterium sp. zg-Y1211]MDL5486623.1 DUF4129 domain-containing protein [Microbacterium sp. zg-Y1211]
MGTPLNRAVPLIPDGDEARRWAEQELADPVYDIAEPTPLDRFAHAVAEFFANLFGGGVPEGWGPWIAVVASVVVVAVVVIALAVWGMPRMAARSARPVDLFGATEQRSAAQLRAAAESHAAAGEWDAAITERFRALARALGERGIVDAAPGATVHAFARDAARAFPALADRLDAAAATFDDVRYLRRPGTAVTYRAVASVDDDAAASAPARLQPAGVAL